MGAQAFSGNFNLFDFVMAGTVLAAQGAADLGSLVNAGTALSPGKLAVQPSSAGPGYSVVVYDFDAGFNLVSILGTQSLQQLLAELALSSLTSFDGMPGQVSQYTALDAAFSYGTAFAASDKTKPYVFVGHSLGGACANVLASFAANLKDYTVQGVYTLGAPRVGNAAFAAALNFPNLALQNSGDPVPSIPQAVPGVTSVLNGSISVTDWGLYVSAGSAYTLDADGTYGTGSITQTPTQIIAALLTGNIDNHYVAEYLARALKSQYVAANKIPFANGYEKPWQLLGLLEPPPPPGYVPGPPISVPSSFTNHIVVTQYNLDGTTSPLGTWDDTPPLSFTPVLAAAPGSVGSGTCCPRG